MAIHWVGVDSDDLETPKSGTSKALASAHMAISWVNTDVSRPDKILESLHVLRDYIEQDKTNRPAGKDFDTGNLKSKGYSVPLDGTVADVVFTDGSGGDDTDSVLNNASTGSVALESSVFDGAFSPKFFDSLYAAAVQALMETDIPLA